MKQPGPAPARAPTPGAPAQGPLDPEPAAPPATPPLAAPAPAPATDRLPRLVWLIAAVFVAIELAVSARYGFMQDELYFIDAGRHLAFGYVDQPPLMPLLDKATGLFGLHPTVIRVIPALAGGAVIIIAARFAVLFGGGRRAQILAALAMACAPVLIGADHLGNTTPIEFLTWALVLLCVATALLRDRPRWWLGAGAAAGVGLEDNYLLVTLLIAVLAGLIFSPYRPALRTRWPWLGVGVATIIWLPNLIWQATHGWPQLAMSSALHMENSSAASYAGAVPAQLVYLGLLVSPLVVAGFVRLWRTPELRFLAIAASLIFVYVLAWVPGKPYYFDGLAPVILAAGAVAAERWQSRARHPRARWAILLAAPLVPALLILPLGLPILPVSVVHSLPKSSQANSNLGDTIGFPQLARAVAAQDAALVRAGQPPTSIFTGFYGEAAAVDVFGNAEGAGGAGGRPLAGRTDSTAKLPPVLSGHNAYWMWGPGRASDRTVLVVDALAQLRPYFGSCRLLTTYHAPYRVKNDWTNIRIGVCTSPRAGWPTLWPHLKFYG
jgi:4-amino-4-deoxy-L-arabinose transferase-like glycosyltransferase